MDLINGLLSEEPRLKKNIPWSVIHQKATLRWYAEDVNGKNVCENYIFKITSIPSWDTEVCTLIKSKCQSLLEFLPLHHPCTWNSYTHPLGNWICIYLHHCDTDWYNPDSKIHGTNVGHNWGHQDPDGPLVGHMNLAIWERWHKGLILISTKMYYK